MKEIRSAANLLVLERLTQLHVVGVGSHCDGQLADDLEVDGAPVGGGDEGIHPPVGGLGQQVDKGLQETDTQVLEILGGLYLGRVGEADVALRKMQTGESLRTGGADSSRQAERILASVGATQSPQSHTVLSEGPLSAAEPSDSLSRSTLTDCQRNRKSVKEQKVVQRSCTQGPKTPPPQLQLQQRLKVPEQTEQ